MSQDPIQGAGRQRSPNARPTGRTAQPRPEARWDSTTGKPMNILPPNRTDMYGGYGNPDNNQSGAQGGQFNLAEMLGEQGQQQFSLAAPAYEKGLGFYSDLLDSAGKQRQALAPAISNINEGGVGARSSIRNRFARSGAKNMAFAEEERKRQGDVNTMLAGAPLIGAEGLADLSVQGLNQSLQAGALSSGALAQASQSAASQRTQDKDEGDSNWSRWASIGAGVASIFGL